MLDANLNPIAAKTESLPIRADVDIVIGEKDVRVKAYGLVLRFQANSNS